MRVIRFAFALAFLLDLISYNPTDIGKGALPQIVFVSNLDGFSARIYVMNADGSNPHRLGTLAGSYEDPEFSPDNRKIVFSCASRRQEWQVCIMNADGSHLEFLTQPPGWNRNQRFMPDGRILYSHELHPGSTTETVNSAQYVMEIDGSKKTLFPITAPGIGEITDPAFGPRGVIAFTNLATVGGYERVSQILTMNVDGTNLKRLTDSIESSEFPVWSPDGAKIAFANVGANPLLFSNLPAHHEHDGIYTLNADGTHVSQVVRIDFGKELPLRSSILSIGPSRDLVQLTSRPSFSPDGTKLTYAVNLEGGDQIYVVNVDGTGLKKITNLPSQSWTPSFSR